VIVQWHDSNIVTLASNCHPDEPLEHARRWSHKEQKVITINQPYIVAAYNKYMGGVDRVNQNTATYRISIRMVVDSILISFSSTVNNAWLQYRNTETFLYSYICCCVYLSRKSQISRNLLSKTSALVSDLARLLRDSSTDGQFSSHDRTAETDDCICCLANICLMC